MRFTIRTFRENLPTPDLHKPWPMATEAVRTRFQGCHYTLKDIHTPVQWEIEKQPSLYWTQTCPLIIYTFADAYPLEGQAGVKKFKCLPTPRGWVLIPSYLSRWPYLGPGSSQRQSSEDVVGRVGALQDRGPSRKGETWAETDTHSENAHMWRWRPKQEGCSSQPRNGRQAPRSQGRAGGSLLFTGGAN